MAIVRRVCAWCSGAMGTVEGDFLAKHPVTHGICPNCARLIAQRLGLSTFSEFLDGLGVPVLLMDEDLRVLTANRLAKEALGKDLPHILGYKGGDVIECRNAKLPGGCGQTVHCRGCVIRNSVNKTRLTGESCVKVPAYPDVQLGAERKTLSLKITTEKVGACVLLRIDEIRASSGR